MIPKKYTILQLDQTSLDMELQRNILILHFWLGRIRTLTSERDSVKTQIKTQEAKIRIELEESQKPGERRLTGDQVDSRVNADDSLVNLQSDLITINSELAEAYNYRDLYNDRREAIQTMVKLFLNNYYADGKHDELEVYSEKGEEIKRKESVRKTLDSALKKRGKNHG